MISTKRFVNKLREIGYSYKDRTKRMEVYRKDGGTHIVMVPRKTQVTELWAINTLKQCGCTDDEITDFIRDCRS